MLLFAQFNSNVQKKHKICVNTVKTRTSLNFLLIRAPALIAENTRLVQSNRKALALCHWCWGVQRMYRQQLPQRSRLMETIVKGGQDQRRMMCTSYCEYSAAAAPVVCWGLSFGFNQWACSMPRPCTGSHLFIGNLITWAILNSVGEAMRVMSLLPWVTVSAWEAGQGKNSHKWLVWASFICFSEKVHLLWV